MNVSLFLCVLDCVAFLTQNRYPDSTKLGPRYFQRYVQTPSKYWSTTDRVSLYIMGLVKAGIAFGQLINHFIAEEEEKWEKVWKTHARPFSSGETITDIVVHQDWH